MKERQAKRQGMQEPEIQNILSDPHMRHVPYKQMGCGQSMVRVHVKRLLEESLLIKKKFVRILRSGNRFVSTGAKLILTVLLNLEQDI